ncbi:Saccharolysin [Dactylellina cionopaga]|nr:Saccharolysin [Dactylellina cionopaga]
MQPAFTNRVASRTLWRQQFSLSALSRPTTKQNYICNNCLRRYRTAAGSRYLQQEASTASTSIDTRAVSSTIPLQQHPHFESVDKQDDALLRAIFDSPDAYRAFSSSKRSRTGLFQNRYLTSPNGFIIFANSSLKKAKKVAERVTAASSKDDLVRVVKDLDRLSDLLCRVLDLADFVRSTHPNGDFVEAADRAYINVYEYMNILNTTSGLYKTLKRAMKDPEVVSHFGEAEKAVGRTLLSDFEKSGINLDDRSKRKFVSLSNDISRLGREFVNTASAAVPYIPFDATQLAGMEPWTVAKLSKMSNTGKVYLPARGPVAHHALQTATDVEVRATIYKEQQTASDRQIVLLEELLRKRGALANLVGRESHAAVTLVDKMARSPEAVTAFLNSMLNRTRPLAMKELDKVKEVKKQYTNQENVELYPWDKDFYLHKLVEMQKRQFGDPDVSAYFSLGTVMQGLSRLFTRLYGVRLVPRETAPGEIWNNDVRRLDVISEDEGHIAVVYCDLFQRPEKNPNPAHFTVRCSRALDEEEIEEYGLESGGGDGMATARNKDGVLYQLPTIVLICDFSTPAGSSTPLLGFHEVTTLFHEMGHAIHSILGRTKYHEVAGTRCPTDFAEFPSILMEHFARSPEVLSLYARHYLTDQPLPEDLIRKRLTYSPMMEHNETYQQVVFSLLDQELHSAQALGPSFDSTQIYRNLEAKHTLFVGSRDAALATSWQGYFTHLFGYGSLYYSYMLDKCIADKVWKEVFRADPVNRIAGEKYKEEVLKWGGSRDPWKCIGKLLDREDLAEEGGKRMEEVGKWGLEASEV